MKLIELYEPISKAIKPDMGMSHKLNDPVGRPFAIIEKQKNELQAAKLATLSHVWARDNHGKVELAPLDGEFKQLQGQISALETKVAQNQVVIEALTLAYERNGIDVETLQGIEEERHDLEAQISKIDTSVIIESRPYHEAAAVMGTTATNHPKVLEIKARAEEQKRPLQERIATLEKWAAAINVALAGLIV